MNLIVVESPTKARTLSRFLGKEFIVEATVGHIKDLPKSKLGIDVKNNFTPDYVLVKDKEKNVNEIKIKAKGAKAVYLATDPDREGEAIAAHVKELLGDGKTKRIVFHEITRSAVEFALKNPKDVNANLVNAQIARRVLDRLVGYKLSPLLWKKIRRGLSAGRVQTVTVRLIVEREREIQAFKPKEYWEIFCDVKKKGFKGKTEIFSVKLIRINDKKAEIGNRVSANKVTNDLKKADYQVSDIIKREVKKYPFAPFTTSMLTQSAARAYFWSTKRTMSIAQKLYEEGLITYHRTDSTHISKVALKAARNYIRKNFNKAYLPTKANVYKTKAKVAQEAHEAIRPTKVSVTQEEFGLKRGLVNDHKKLYGLIWTRFITSQMTPSIYDETKIRVVAFQKTKDKSKQYFLSTSGRIMKFDGWRALLEGSNKNGNKLPSLEKGQDLDLVKVSSEQKFTEPPARYGEASLVKTLESLGIGRPSTYAPIISTIQIRNYVEKIEGKFHPTPVGLTVNDFLVKYFPNVFNYSFTAEMEDNLDAVANGEAKWNMNLSKFWKPFEKKLNSVLEKSKRVKIEAELLGKKCPDCKKGNLVIRIGRFGKFISCSNFPDCKHTERYVQKVGMDCPECKSGDVIIKSTKKRRKFYGCSRYPDCNWASWKKPQEVKKDN